MRSKHSQRACELVLRCVKKSLKCVKVYLSSKFQVHQCLVMLFKFKLAIFIALYFFSTLNDLAWSVDGLARGHSRMTCPTKSCKRYVILTVLFLAQVPRENNFQFNFIFTIFFPRKFFAIFYPRWPLMVIYFLLN